jgi:hypothetical protein
VKGDRWRLIGKRRWIGATENGDPGGWTRRARRKRATKGGVAPYRFDAYVIDTGLVAARATNGGIAPYRSDVCLIATGRVPAARRHPAGGNKAHVGLVG